jgi:sugar lactone lactonase YvrE
LFFSPPLARAPQKPAAKAPLEVLVTRSRAPTGIAVDPDGTVYFTDRKEGRLWQRAPTGSLTILLERLEQPRGLVRGEDGTLYFVADDFEEHPERPRSKGVLLKRSPDDGTVTILAEDFRKPKQLAFDQDHRLLLSTRGGLPQAEPAGEEAQDERDDDEAAEDDAAADAEEDEERGVPPAAFRGTVFRVHPEEGQILGSHSGFRRPSGLVADEAETLTVAAKAFRVKEPPLKGTLFQIPATGDVTVLVEERFQRPKGLVRDVLGQFFLAVKGDREKPKDGGLILKISPDGSFTRFAQGLERPWGLTFDPQGNLYVTDPKAGKIYRFFAPPAPALAVLPERTTESRIGLSGTAEPKAKITVRGGQEETTTFADAQGAFSLEVPLLPDQVNALKVHATGAQGEGLTSAPALAVIQQQTTPPPPSVTLILQITEPSPGATVTANSVLVRGFVDAGGLEVGITVNGIPAAVSGNTFAALVPVNPGTNTLTALATTVTGVSATQSVAITVEVPSVSPVILHASPAGGVAPLNVGFTVLGGPAPVKIELDLEGDGTVDFTGTGLDGQIFTYSKPGIYAPRMKLTDSEGRQFAASSTVQVYDQVVLDAQLQAKWSGLKDALRAGDVARAASFFHSSTRAAYQSQLSRFNPAALATIDRWMTTIQRVEVGPGGAQYEMLREEGGEIFSFAVWFQLDEDGFWRLRRF